jgi:hypothetical protein
MHPSSLYPGALMPYSLFFVKEGRDDVADCAFHQWDTFAPSHGCIHLNGADAQWLFEWAGDDPVRVSVHGPNPEAPVRARVYLRGGDAMLPRVIEAINRRLNELDYLRKPVDLAFDEATEDAVRRFQHDKNLTEDGKVGMIETAPRLGVTL